MKFWKHVPTYFCEPIAVLAARSRVVRLAALFVLCAGGCTPGLPAAASHSSSAAAQPVLVRARPFAARAGCSGAFVPHDLDHVTTTVDGEVRMYEANGAGVALHDLDNDGDLDIVLGNYDGANTLLWNSGDLTWRRESMPIGRTRALSAVDVDADGWTDLVLTRVGGAVNFWRNMGPGQAADSPGRFEQDYLPGVGAAAYAVDWADLDQDGDLDLVTASYDIGLLTERGDEYLLGGGGGVFVHENRDGLFVPRQLAIAAQALALALWDVDLDGRLDITVGNDFAVPDYVWLANGEGWLPASPFVETSYSTMSYDLGDVDNRGALALFASDMKPYSTDPAVLAAWAPIQRELWFSPEEEDPQRQENVLQIATGEGYFANQAYRRGADASGWSWSALFGDLDQDGWLDLYVVNGFMEREIFAYLPDHELVERNQVLRNDGRGGFVRMPAWNLGSLRSGRGLAQGDLDGDGDLDLVVNNLRGAAQLFENQLCRGSALQVDLRWPRSPNPRAVGARVFLDGDMGRLRRDVRVTRGYLSSDPGRLHFGVPSGAHLERLEIRWPDGAVSQVEDLAPGMLLTVERR